MAPDASTLHATPPGAPGVSLAHFSFSDDRHVAAVSTRAGGVSAAPYDSLNLSFSVGDEPAAVEENRRLLCQAIGEPLDALTCANQVHAGDVVVVDATHRGHGARHGGAPVADADALVTATPGVVLGVLLADCVPVALIDPVRHVVAVAHAGWRGTIAHVAANTVATMIEQFGCDPADLRAGIGPSIGPETYEVSDDVVAAAGAAFPHHPEVIRTRDGRTYFDLWAANRIDLVRAGVDPRQIEVAGVDSRTSTDRYFSHRAAQPTGRFMAVVSLRDR